MNPKSSRPQKHAPQPVTLLELVEAASAVCEDENEVVTAVTKLLQEGTVELQGNFRDEPPENF